MSKFFTSPIICKQPETKTVSEWLIQYDEILTTRPFGAKTLANRRNYIKYLKEGFGDALITDIKPHHVAQLVRAIPGRTFGSGKGGSCVAASTFAREKKFLSPLSMK